MFLESKSIYQIHRFLILLFVISIITTFVFCAEDAKVKEETPFYVTERQKAFKLGRKRKHKEALDAYVVLSEGKYSDFQKDDALEQAIYQCLMLRKYDLANELSAKLTDEKRGKLAKLSILSYQRKWKDVITLSESIDFQKWPESIRSQGYSFRGKAYYSLKNGEKALADINNAITYTTSSEARGDLYYLAGEIYSKLFNDDEKAVSFYQKMHKAGRVDLSRQLQCILTTVKILKKQKKYTEAAKELARVKVPGGYWSLQWLSSQADLLLDQGKKDEAVLKYKELLADKTINKKYKDKYKKIVLQLETMLAAEKAAAENKETEVEVEK